MKFIDEYRQGDIAQKLAEQIAGLTDQPLKFMEVCGGHTHTIFKYGIEDLLPPNITMIHGPGCPPGSPSGARRRRDLDSRAARCDLHHLRRRRDARARLADEPARREGFGADVRMVYSPLDALKIAKKNPERQVVFLALGFETTRLRPR